MSDIHKSNPITTAILWILTVALLGMSFLFAYEMSKLNKAYEDIMQVEAISSTTQRQISLAENNEQQMREVFNIGELTVKALTVDGENAISLMSDASIALLATGVLAEWIKIEEMLSVNWNLEAGESAKELDYISLRLARDAHFSSMTDLSDGIGDYTKDLNSLINQYQLTILVLAIFIGLLLFHKALQMRAELILSKEMAELSQLDTATGLYNRSRCQELLKGEQGIGNLRTPAFMVLDLNDLKKTNDSLGHRVGDELIYSFANILKNAANIHTLPPFIGRYGGDEFVVFYEDIKNEDELQIFLKELAFLTKEQNEKESRFQVSYAVGYSYVNSDNAEQLTARQLFDQADEAMYVNKQEVKRARNQNLEEEQAKGEVR